MTPIDDEAQAPFIQEVADGEEEQGPKTLAEQLKQRRSEIAETRDVLLPLTGYDEFGVVVKHRLMDRTEVERIGRRVITETKERGERNMRILLDVIINSTRGFYLQEDGKEPQEIIDDTNGNQSVLNWSMFAHYLG